MSYGTFFSSLLLFLCPWDNRSKPFCRCKCIFASPAVVSHTEAELTRCQSQRPVCTIDDALGEVSDVYFNTFAPTLCACAINSLCLTNSILLSSVFIQLPPFIYFKPPPPTDLLSVENASGQGLLLICHQPSGPQEGGIRCFARNLSQ